MNDVQIVDYQDDKNHALGGVYAGMIALQIHYTNATTPRAIPNGVHRYRNIAIKELN
jgi:hydroxymethylglutaryl-CoA reductase